MKIKSLLLFVGAALLSGACSDEPEVPVVVEPTISTTDSLAVIDIYHAARLDMSFETGKDWNLEDWHTWNGVNFELIDGEYHVTSLKLTAGIVMNEISSSVSELKYLRHFHYIACGGMYGVGPVFDCPLQTLIILGNDDIDETGPKNILLGIGKVTETLERIEVYGCQESISDDNLPLYKCNNLKILRIVNCNLSGEVPARIGRLGCMADLSHNKFTSIDWKLFTERLNVPLLTDNLIKGPVPEEVAASEWWRLYGYRLMIE